MKIAALLLIAIMLSGIMLSPSRSFSDTTSVTDKTLIGTGFPIGKGRLAEFDGMSSVLYMSLSGSGGVYAFFRDNLGETSNVLLPSFPSSANYGCGEYIMTAKDEMWIFFGTGPLTAVQYKFSGSPLPTVAMLVSSKTFGDSSSFCPSLIKLSSGALIGAWTQKTAYNSTSGALGFAYHSPSGNWSQIFPYTVKYSTGGVRLALAQHPVDNSIWVFSKQDGAQQIYANHLTETSNGLSVDWTDTNFITQGVDGTNGPEGEFPYLVAVGDKSRNAILLAYQDDQYKIYSQYVKGAYVSIAQINTDKTKSFLVFPKYVERADYLGLVALPDSISLGYFPINETTLTYNDAYVSSYSNGSWGQSVFLGTSYQNPSGLGYGINSTQFAVDLNLYSGNQLYLFHGSTTIPPTVSITSPTNGSTIAGITTLNVGISDSLSISKIQLYLDSTLYGETSTTPYTFTLDTTKISNGAHTVLVKAFDISGNSASSQITINISNVVTASTLVSITNPAAGSTVTGKVAISLSASASSGISNMKMYIDNVLVTQMTSGPYTYKWNTSNIASGIHTITAKAYGVSGNNGVASETVYVSHRK